MFSPKIFFFSLGLMISVPAAVFSAPSADLLLANPQVVTSSDFDPEPYSTLPSEAVAGIDEAAYAKCIAGMGEYNVKFYRINYLSDGLRVAGIIGLPKDFDPAKKYPLVLFNRGGNQEFGRITACGLRALAYRYSNDGEFIVAATQYRGVAGGEGREEFGGADVDDVLKLLEIGRSYSFVDERNIFLAGHSRGGMMTYLALKRGAKVNAAIVLAGPTDLFALAEERPEMEEVFNELIPGIHENRAEALGARSALFWAESLRAPLLILHGTADQRVAFTQATALDAKLSQLNFPYRFVAFPNEGHHFSTATAQVKAEIQNWIRSHLVFP